MQVWVWVSSGHSSPIHSKSEPLNLARFTLSRASLQSRAGEAGASHPCDAPETPPRAGAGDRALCSCLDPSLCISPAPAGAGGLRKPKAFPGNRPGSLLLAKSWDGETPSSQEGEEAGKAQGGW